GYGQGRPVEPRRVDDLVAGEPVVGAEFDAVDDGAAPALRDAHARSPVRTGSLGDGGRPAAGVAGGDGTDQCVEERDGGVDLGGALLEAGQHVAGVMGGDGEQVGEVEVELAQVQGGVVAPGVGVQAAGPRDVAEYAEVAGVRGAECGGAGEPVGGHPAGRRQVDDGTD